MKNFVWLGNGRFPILFLLVIALITLVIFPATTDAHHVPTDGYWNASGTLPANITHHTFTSTYLNINNNTVGLNVYTPPGYETPGNTQRYPVIYVLHGLQGDEFNYFSWYNNIYTEVSLLSLIEGTVPHTLAIPQAIVVFVNGGAQSYYNNFTDQHHGPTSPFPILSESIIINEVIPFVDNNFRTIATRNGRSIEGFSMGGRGALKLAFKYPHLFCSVVGYAGAAYEEIALPPNSPYLGPLPDAEKMSTIVNTNTTLILQNSLKIMLLVGENDTPQVNQNVILNDQLTSLGIPHQAELSLPNIGHDWGDLHAIRAEVALNFHQQCFQTAVPTSTPTRTPSTTPTTAASATPTRTPSRTPSATPTTATSATPTRTPSRTPSSTPTTATSATPTRTPSRTPSPTPTIAASATPTRTPSPTVTPVTQNSGFKSPSANIARTGGDGNGFQTSASNAFTNNASFAVDTNSGTGTSTSCSSTQKDNHLFYNYGFSIPANATILGIEVRLDAKVDGTGGAPKMCVQLSKDGGVTWTAVQTTPTLGTAESTYTLGGATNTWGMAWNSNSFSNTNFRLRIINIASDTNRDFSLDWAAVKVYFR